MRSLLLCVLVITSTLPASAQTQRRTVLDYYKLLPQRFFALPEAKVPRIKWLRDGFTSKVAPHNRSIVDLKNDYLRSPSEGAQGQLTVAVFRFHGQETVGVFNNFESGELSFWRLKNGRLSEVTRSVFPFQLPEANVELPRKGTTISVWRGNGYSAPKSKNGLGRFAWRQGRFHRVSR